MTRGTTRTLSAQAETWPMKGTFTISRGSRTASEVVVATIVDGDVTGRGECVPYAHYGETVAGVVAAIAAQADAVAHGLDRQGLRQAMALGAARNALDAALWDMEAKQTGKRAWDIAGIAAPAPTVTAETIGIDTAAAMGAAAAALQAPPLLKIKLDAGHILERVGAVRAAQPGARLIVDANEAWSVDLLVEIAPELANLGVEMIEQPLPAGADGGLAEITSPVPLCADESCHGVDHLDALAGSYQVVNIKLDKTGGLTEALDLAARARQAGFQIMIGCMVGTSLAMAPATLLAAEAAFVDLDGPLLLKHDRDHGLDYTDGKVHAPDAALWG